MVDIDRAKFWLSTIVIIGLLSAVGVIVIDAFGEDQLSTSSVSNETISGWTTSTNKTVSKYQVDSFLLLTSTVLVYNNSADATLYTVNTDYIAYSDGTLSWLTASDEISDKNVSYSYNHGNVVTATMDNSTKGLANFTKQLPTVGTVLGVMLIVLVITFMAMYFGRKMY
jgi:predicted heme/steroid binding protein